MKRNSTGEGTVLKRNSVCVEEKGSRDDKASDQSCKVPAKNFELYSIGGTEGFSAEQ